MIDFGEQMLRDDALALITNLQEWAASHCISCETNEAFPGVGGTIKLSKGAASGEIAVRTPTDLGTMGKAYGVWGIAMRYGQGQEDADLLACGPQGWQVLLDDGTPVVPCKSAELGSFLLRKLNAYFHLGEAPKAASQSV